MNVCGSKQTSSMVNYVSYVPVWQHRRLTSSSHDGPSVYELNETIKLQQLLKDLKTTQSNTAESTSSSSTGASTQSMEIYALQIQLYSRQKDNKKLRDVFNKAMA